MLIQVVSIIGAFLVLIAFAAHQLERMDSQTVIYQLMNLSGGLILCVAAIQSRQAGLIVMEGAWVLISGYGLWKVMSDRRRPEPPEPS